MALAAAKEEDPWLNSIDPDGNQDGIVQKLTRRITEKKKRNPKSSSNRAKPQHHHQRNQPVSKTPSGQNSAPFVNQPAALTTKSDPHPQQKSEWIETEATPAGYVKHPLEKLLELLDGTMFWLEDLLVKIWRWIKQI